MTGRICTSHFQGCLTAGFLDPLLDSRVHVVNLFRRRILAIYGPLIYTVPYLMILMRENTLRGKVGGVLGGDPGNGEIFGPSEIASSF